MSEENIGFVRGLYEAFARGDVPTVLAGFDENIEWNESEGMPYGGIYHSPAEVAENVFAPIPDDFDDFDVTPEEILADGDRVVVLLTYTGTAKATGNELRMPAAHAWKVRDGKVTHFLQLADSAIMNAAMGVAAAA
jgi:uncharacterized protein